MAEAYVLAGELLHSGSDHRVAFARYEERMQPFLRQKQQAAAGFASSFAPKSRFGIVFRDFVTRLLGLPFVGELVLGRSLRDDFDLPDYGF
jgi:2-polyprenyl-6-methoxyphenol hydroxylase-like FAD-dependent oxidoreductase